MRHCCMAACHIQFGVVVGVILIHFAVFIPGSRVDGGFMAYRIRHQFR
jgi:hypothetical protein